MLGLGLLTIFNYVGLFILALLVFALFAILGVGWYFCFAYGHHMFGVLILLVDLLIIAYLIGDYVLHVTIPAKKKAQTDV